MIRLMWVVALALFAGLAPSAQAGVPCSLPFTLTNGTLADANQVMANYNALVACLGNAAAAGANNDITALNSLTTPISPGQGGTNVYIGGTSTGSANAQVVATTTPNSFTLAPGQRVVFVPGFTNTGATQLNVHSTGLVNVTRQTATGVIPLVGNELVVNQITEAVYDGTQFVLLETIAGLSGGFGPRTAIASAATTDLGLVPSHNVQITGNTTITSFGASANVALPVYLLQFTGGLTLTFNGASLLLPGAANINTSTGDTAVALYLGSGNWQVLSYQRANGASVISSVPIPGALGLKIINNAGTPTTLVDYSADFVTMFNATFNTSTSVQSISGTINTTNQNVINGIDGPRGNSTWYKIFIMNNGTTTGAYMSATAATTCSGFTNPLSGYNNCVYVGSFRTDSSGNFLSEQIVGNTANYVIKASGNTTTLPQLAGTGAATWPVTIALSTFVPPSTTRVKVLLLDPSSANPGVVAPNSLYNPLAGSAAGFCGFAGPASGTGSIGLLCEMTLEGANIFWGSGGGNTLSMYSWTDKVNAN